MLKTTKTVRFTGKVYVGTVQVVYMNADIDEDGNPSFQSTTTDNDLFRANRAACKSDINDFEDIVYEESDRIVDELTSGNTTEGEE